MIDDASSPVAIEVYNSVGGAAFLQQLMAEWRREGLQVELIEAMSEADYRRARGRWGRLMRRGQMYAGYAGICWWAARRVRPGSRLRIVTTNPFFAPALVAASGKRGEPTINLLYDLYPEAMIQAGTARADSWLAQRAARITRYALRECAATVFLGERLRRFAEAAHGNARHGVVIPVGADGAPFRDHPPRPLKAGQKPQLLYAGQMGHMHDVKTMGRLWPDAPAGVEWHFHASGAGYAQLQRQVGRESSISWGGPLEDAAWQERMKAAHIAVVTMAPGAERVVMPSKTYSALVAGQAVLAICPRQSDLADLIELHDCGWVVEPGDTDELRRVIERIARDPASLQRKRVNAYTAGHECYCVTQLARSWIELFAELGVAREPLLEAP